MPDISVFEDGSVPLRIKLQTCDTIDDFNVSYASYPPWKKYSGYTLIFLALLVTVSTLTAYFRPKSPLNQKLHFLDAAYNTRKLNHDVLDQENQRLVFIAGLRTVYMAIVSYAHIVFVSGIASKETHCE